MYGPMQTFLNWIEKKDHYPLPVFHPIISVKQDSCGETRFIAGTSLKRPDSNGGSSALLITFNSSMYCVLTTSEVLWVSGKFPRRKKLLSTVSGSKHLLSISLQPC